MTRQRFCQSNAHPTGDNLHHTDAVVAVDTSPTLPPQRPAANYSPIMHIFPHDLVVCTRLCRLDSVLYSSVRSSKSSFCNGDHSFLFVTTTFFCATSYYQVQYLVYGYTKNKNMLGTRAAPLFVQRVEVGTPGYSTPFGISFSSLRRLGSPFITPARATPLLSPVTNLCVTKKDRSQFHTCTLKGSAWCRNQ